MNHLQVKLGYKEDLHQTEKKKEDEDRLWMTVVSGISTGTLARNTRTDGQRAELPDRWIRVCSHPKRQKKNYKSPDLGTCRGRGGATEANSSAETEDGAFQEILKFRARDFFVCSI